MIKKYSLSLLNSFYSLSIFLFLISFNGFGQTTLLSPTVNNGGFEDATALNGWSTSQAGTGRGGWANGTATFYAGTKSAYISRNNGTNNNYLGDQPRVQHLYRAIAFPVGETIINLSFHWKANGEGSFSDWDNLKVFVSNTIPTAGTENLDAERVGADWYNQQTSWQNVSLTLPTAYAGTTKYLIFQWKQDTSGTYNPPAAVDNITLTSQAPPTCSGSPTGGAVTVNPTSGNPGSTYGVTASGYTTGTGLTYQWQYSDGTGWNNQGTATASYAALTGQTAPALGVVRTWRLRVTCTASASSANSSTGTFTSVISYCTPVSTNTLDYISNFSTTGGITNINNPSGGLSGTGYGDFYATHSASQVAGGLLNFTETYNGGSHGFSIWVDLNNNGTFETAERLYNAATTEIGHTGTITIPGTTIAGDYRMRIRAWWNNLNPDPCTSIGFGEAEDYRLTVIALTPCSGTPNGGAVTVNPTSGNPGSTYGVTATGYTTGTGLTYQWQYSDTGGASWTNQSTATTSYAALTGQTAPALGVVRTWRLVVTCTNSGLSANSSTGTFASAISYCTPTNTNSTSYFISGVTTSGGVADINNTPTGFSEYTDYTSIFVSQYPGSNFTLNATHPSSTYGYNVWVDWNDDGDFNDTGENVISTGYLATPATLGTVTIPGGQTPGNYRMRIRNAYLSNPAPACGEFDYGEAEDYTVTVLTLNCTANPQNLTAIVTTTTTTTVNWSAPTPPPNNGYEYIISTDNTVGTPAGDITGTTTGTSINLTGLTLGTTYYVFVRSVCNATDNGAWINTNFNTGCTNIVNTPTLCPTIIIDEQGNDPFAASPFILNPSANIDCSTDTVTLSVNPNLKETTSYIVEQIIYPNPVPYYDFPILEGNQQVINTDDVWATSRTNIGFPFCFYDNTYTQTLVGANGMTTFDNSIVPGSSCGWSFNNNLPSTAGALFEQTIYGVYHDIDPSGLTGAPIKSRTIGTAPCRQFQVSWTDIPMFGDASRLYTGMIVLHEATNIIEVFIETKLIENGNVYPWNDGNAIVGIQGDITPLGPNNQYAVAPCRNGLDTNWETTNEAWRFTPNGADVTPSTVTWYQGSINASNVIASNPDNSVTVSTGGTYFAVASFNTCSGTINLTDEIVVNDNRKVWRGTVNTDWYTPANWSGNAIPTSSDCVIIPDLNTTNNNSPIVIGGPPTPPPPGLARSLRVLSNGYLELTSESNLIVTDNIYIEDAIAPYGKIVIRDDGNLIQINNSPPSNNVGNIQMQRNVNSLTNLNYVYWSSPVNGFNVTNVSPGTNNNLIWHWIPTVASNGIGHYGTWQNTTEVMLPGKGYIVRGISGTSPETTPALNTVEFTGIARNGIISHNITHGNYSGGDYPGAGNTMATELDDNWNLVGNPYPSSISATKFITQNASIISTDNPNPAITGTIYLWNHLNLPSNLVNDPFYGDYVYNYNPNNYIAFNNTGANPPGFNGNIASGQAFFVLMDHNASTTGSSIVFNNNMRYDDTDPLNPSPYANNEFFRVMQRPKPHVNRNTIERHRIWLDLIAPNDHANSILVGYVENATNGEDRLYDGFDLSKTSIRFYSLINEDKMSIQGRSLPFDVSDTVPLGLVIPENGNYTIAINSIDGLFSNTNQDIFLEDTYLNIIHDLRIAPYSFNTDAGTFNDRFILRYTNNTLNIEEFETNAGISIVAPNNSYIKITSSLETIKSVTIYDVLGRVLYNNLKIHETEIIVNNISNSDGVLFVKAVLDNGIQKTQKVVIKQ